MNRTHRKADSLDRVEILMSLEEKHPELAPAFEALWKLDADFDENALVPVGAYITAPFEARAIRAGIETRLTVFARHDARVLAIDHDCAQFAIGTLEGKDSVRAVRHYRTLELACRAFLGEVTRSPER